MSKTSLTGLLASVAFSFVFCWIATTTLHQPPLHPDNVWIVNRTALLVAVVAALVSLTAASYTQNIRVTVIVAAIFAFVGAAVFWYWLALVTAPV